MFPELLESYSDWIIKINPNLKFSKAEKWKKGIIRKWGFDPKSKRYKLMYAQYPKENFTKQDMIRILPEYNTCPNCHIGKKFINKNDNNTSMAIQEISVIDTLGKIPMVGSYITSNRMISEKIVMQILAVLARYPISIIFKPWAKRLISAGIGLVGVATVYNIAKSTNVKSEWLEFFSNMLTSAAEMDATGDIGFGAGDDLRRFVKNVQAGNFKDMPNSFIKTTPEMKRIINRLTMGNNLNFKGLELSFQKFSNDVKTFFNSFRTGRLRLTETTIPKDSRLMLGNKQYGRHQFQIKEAGDFKYVGTADRFREIGDFSPGFKSKRRLRESSDRIY